MTQENEFVTNLTFENKFANFVEPYNGDVYVFQT